MSSRQVRHREVREALAHKITAGELRPGDRLPAERQLQEDFDCARSVVRQALAALTRDGWIMSAYPRGYLVLGPRIPWISRLRLLSTEPWTVEIDSVREDAAPPNVAEALEIAVGASVVVRTSRLGSDDGKEVWGAGASSYPAEALSEDSRRLLLASGEITYDDLEAAFGRRIVGYRETIRARQPSERETRDLGFLPSDPVLEVQRISRTTGPPISAFTFVGRSDRFEVDYLVEA
ncbi:MAG: GntR family transcriptional regulator [Thermoleophilia bacterium]